MAGGKWANASSIKKLNKEPAIPQQEWDFRDCPDVELPYCVYYEYGREVLRLKKSLSREQIEKKFGNPSLIAPTKTERYRKCLPKDGVRLAPDSELDFAFRDHKNVPWLKIKESARMSILAVYFRETGTKLLGLAIKNVSVEYLKDEPNGGKHLDRRDVIFGGRPIKSYCVFEINWNFSKRQLVETFADWATQNRPADMKAVDLRGKSKWRDLLKALGAYRLLSHHSVEEAKLITQTAPTSKELNPPPLYEHDSSWSRARKLAEKALIQFAVTGVIGFD